MGKKVFTDEEMEILRNITTEEMNNLKNVGDFVQRIEEKRR